MSNLLVEKVLTFIKSAHAGQFRNDGRTEYWTHPAEVRRLTRDYLDANFPQMGETEKTYHEVLALLHDVAEDCSPYLNNEALIVEEVRNLDRESVLDEYHRSGRLQEDLKLLNKNNSRDYLDFVLAVKGSRPASVVKTFDIEHNTCDLKDGTTRKDKYLLARHILNS